jgi:ApaG protein
MTETKYQISVSPRAMYIAEQSNADVGRYAFAYTITITNTGEIPAQLISRHWIITDANNLVQEVKGEGVVGAQPKLKPGQSFEYTSGSMLATPVGTMRGSTPTPDAFGETASEYAARPAPVAFCSRRARGSTATMPRRESGRRRPAR